MPSVRSFKRISLRQLLTAAPDYANEEYVGAALAASGLARKDIFITSKYSGGGEIDAALAASLEKVHVGNI